MRPYGQYCGVARSLDLVGDRWSLLVVRELLIRPSRFTELVAGLPGVARNLLAERLRTLQDAGVVAREDDRYVLTDRGRALAPVLRELARWSVPLMVAGQGEDAAQGHWLALGVEALWHGADLHGLDGLQVAVEAGEEPFVAEVVAGELCTRLGVAPDADASLSGSPEAVMGTLTGLGQGAGADGDLRALERLRERLVL